MKGDREPHATVLPGRRRLLLAPAPYPPAHVASAGGPPESMPRLRVTTGTEAGESKEFDVCARCAAEPDIVRTLVTGKLGFPFPPGEAVPVSTTSHRSYDFQPRPVPCLSCARVLTSEDD